MVQHGRLWPAAVAISLSSLLFGAGMSALTSVTKSTSESGSRGSIQHDISLSTQQTELATALLLVGAWGGSLFSNGPSDTYGRRRVLLVNNIFFIAGSVMCSISSRVMLYLGRFLVGVAVGAESVVVPVLLSEIAPAEKRGAVTSLHQLMVTSGILLIGILSYFFVTWVDHGWRYVQLFIAVPAILQVLAAPIIPESPRWMVRKGVPTHHIKSIMEKIRAPNLDLDAEIESMKAEVQAEVNNDLPSWTEVWAKHRREVLLGCGLMTVQALSGINVVILYSSEIFADAGVGNAILATVSVGAVNVLMTLLSLRLVDSRGRKTLLSIGTWIMFFALLALGIVMLTLQSYRTTQGALAVILVLVYIAGFAVGLGAVCWVVLAETVSSRVRSKTTSLFLSVNWAWNVLIAFTTLTTIRSLGGVTSDMDDDSDDYHTHISDGQGRMYLIFAAICVLGLFFIATKVVETKGRTLEEIQAGFRRSVQVSTTSTAKEPLLGNPEENTYPQP